VVFAYPGLAPAILGKVHVQTSRCFQYLYNSHSPTTRPSFSLIFSQLPSVGRLVSYYEFSTPLVWTHPESSVGLAVTKCLDNIAGLKPELLISRSGVDALKYLRRRSFPLSQLDWLRYEYKLSSAPSSPLHHYK
jgi:hypothetical protein